MQVTWVIVHEREDCGWERSTLEKFENKWVFSIGDLREYKVIEFKIMTCITMFIVLYVVILTTQCLNN